MDDNSTLKRNYKIKNLKDNFIQLHRNQEYCFIFVEQGNIGQGKDLITIQTEPDVENLSIISLKVACIDGLNNLQLKNNNNITGIIDNLKNFTNCYKNRSTNKNPLDDFVILVLLECFLELIIVKKEFYFSKLPLNIDNKDIKVITNDNFKDWNIGCMIGFKDFLESINLKKQIFEFPFLFQMNYIINKLNEE